MKRFLWALLAIVSGSALGLALTGAALYWPPNFGTVAAGPWLARNKLGTDDADPYARAQLAIRGEIPVGAVEGLALTAENDSAGNRLHGACTYRLSGPLPAASYWTLSVVQLGSAGERTSHGTLTSSEALYAEKGALTVRLSAEAQPGNWLMLSRGGSFDLVLRLYETQISTTAPALDTATLPAIAREACP